MELSRSNVFWDAFVARGEASKKKDASMGLSRDNVFWDAFSAHAEISMEAAKLLKEQISNLDRSRELADKISELESKGDKITHDVFNHLHKTWITPLDREEIHSLIKMQDDVLDFIEAASDRISLYGITQVTEECTQLVDVILVSARLVCEVMESIKKTKKFDKTFEICIQINDMENAADKIYRRGLAKLFEGKEDPLTVLKWRDIYENLETTTDRCEDVANIIEGIILEHS